MKTDAKTKDEKISAGVEQLIERLRDEGVLAGRLRADEIVAEAERRAAAVIAEAEQTAQSMVAQAQLEVDRLKRGGQDALAIAMRDIVLKLKAQLSDVIGERVKRLIAKELQQEDFLRMLLLEVAGQVREDNRIDECKKVEMVLPRHRIGLEELRRQPLELEEGSLSHFIINVAADELRKGVVFSTSEDLQGGLRIRLVDHDIQIDLTDETLSELLLEHLQPRFRAMLEGMVK